MTGGEGTFTGSRGYSQVAPKPAVRLSWGERVKPTQTGHKGPLGELLGEYPSLEKLRPDRGDGQKCLSQRHPLDMRQEFRFLYVTWRLAGERHIGVGLM
jgi:hypothetical protein